ncbi:MAG: 4-alpha-glucanotransferase [Rhodanobacter sp.]
MDADLIDLARLAGVDVHWRDANDRPQVVGAATLRAVLGHLGLPCETAADLAGSRHRLQQAQVVSTLPPLLTVDAGQAFGVPGSAADRAWRLHDESGSQLEGRLAAGEHQLMAPPRAGYYRLELGSAQAMVAVAPSRACMVARSQPSVAAWGVAVQVSSLRRDGDGGNGDFTALEQAARSAAAQGADALAISPVHALFAALPERYGPYSPSSRLFLNALYVDPARVHGLESWRRVVDQHNLHQELAELERLDLIDWPRAAGARMTVLRTLFERSAADSGQTAQFNTWRSAQGEALERHARFEALQAHFTASGCPGGWQAWPQAFHDPASAQVTAFAREHDREEAFHAFLQWQAALGLQSAQATARDAGMAIGLIADLAVGSDGGGSQAWSCRHEMLHGLSVGAPPDLLNRNGQDWGLTTFSPGGLQQSGYGGFLAMLRAALANAGGVRIDHVLGLRRLWLVPHGASATEGAYVRYPLDDLLRLLKLESHRHHAVVIGEDLGTVPADFRARLGDAGVLGIRVLWFERAADHGFIAPRHWSTDAIATTSTHDVPTVAGWWGGTDIAWRARAGLNDPAADEYAERVVVRSALWRALCASGAATDEQHLPATDDVAPVVVAAAGHVARAPAPLVMIPAEDLLGLSEQPNLPGPTDNVHPNWRRRLPRAAAELFDSPLARATCAAVVAARTDK